MSALPAHKTGLITICRENAILKFGTFTLKSGRESPYFFNAGAFNTASLLSTLSHSYASTINQESAFEFDVVFGPAYKGIPLASTTATALYALDNKKYANTGYAFNRKEAKDHGEGGTIVGASLAGKRVLVVDDVITAGTAIREAVGIIEAAGGKVVGIVVALDRQERLTDQGSESAIMSVRRELNIPVTAILTLGDLIAGVDGQEKENMVQYRERWGVKDE
ncbi:Similar to Orotate phosphoribosyltransferase; acc. no. P41923 [Pyronema omphalodes CBS 100304]|uniref:Orotate phosphoribosyltransferase n=1 Tax=Pyronema omphalodes (strain CBS 100304) TaxID=1076935 RepID=U4LSN2_PYROM|nr:Similar to Orotate phosphoribosyltransferase; acc. no. P41923 [Pyronema omphalodes CBS 100304]